MTDLEQVWLGEVQFPVVEDTNNVQRDGDCDCVAEDNENSPSLLRFLVDFCRGCADDPI